MRPISKGESPYETITKYGDALPHLEARLGSYCSYCGLPIVHAPEVEHVISKSKAPALETAWENLLLGCKYCNTRKSNTVNLENADSYLFPDEYNTAIAYQYAYGVPHIGRDILLALDTSGKAAEKAQNLFDLIKLGNQKDRRQEQRNKVYAIALKALQHWQRNRNDDMKEEILENALANGFFSIWTTVFAAEPEMLHAFIEAFPGTAKDCFTESGTPKAILEHN